MFQEKVTEYINSNRALQTWHKVSESEIDVLKDFAEWLDRDAELHVHPTTEQSGTEPTNAFEWLRQQGRRSLKWKNRRSNRSGGG